MSAHGILFSLEPTASHPDPVCTIHLGETSEAPVIEAASHVGMATPVGYPAWFLTRLSLPTGAGAADHGSTADSFAAIMDRLLGFDSETLPGWACATVDADAEYGVLRPWSSTFQLEDSAARLQPADDNDMSFRLGEQPETAWETLRL
ncbi:hypothetical protein AURDEDRAFT_131900 [Auricularia subglabra TFB-10046 SS5]|uniref:Uncharacterized protein n=1 Tax=Auricularia subglabra (strain TFB-10046 / SS5) TaxID=717982 RepID=J0L9G9_AURST|nr:hypothetical protein AURDEDRAFT_131900 [Auricularia subglabra TFB-10046 SS5]